jgi:thioredoxin reductase (NADPH)
MELQTSTQEAHPVILAVDADETARALLTSELGDRYGCSYRVEVVASAADSRARLLAHATDGRVVALVLADRRSGGALLLAEARRTHPGARRGLLLAWGEHRSAREEVARSLASKEADYFVNKPLSARDELFHRGITEFLDEWSRLRGRRVPLVQVIGDHADPTAHELVDFLHRHDVPYGIATAASEEGRARLEGAGVTGERLPVLVLWDGRVLVAPTVVEAAAAMGARTSATPGVYDVLIVGGGPAGLAAAVYASSEGLRTGLIERSGMGGQAGTSSMIRNYLGFPRGISGAELATRSLDQAIQFGTEMIYGGDVVDLRVEGRHRVVALADGREVRARSVIVATGVSYRRLDVASLARFEGTSVFYGSALSEVPGVTGRDAVVIGGGNSAGQAALHLARFARRVTVVVRSASLSSSMSSYLIHELASTPNIDVRYGTEVVGGGGDVLLDHVVVRDRASGETATLPAAGLFVLIGAAPHTAWMPTALDRDEWGYVVADASTFQTSLPGVFAVGDVRKGAVKRVASAAGEGAMVVQQVHQYLATTDAAAEAVVS